MNQPLPTKYYDKEVYYNKQIKGIQTIGSMRDDEYQNKYQDR